jgi:hypothetical protein
LDEIANAVLRDIPVGTFRSPECQAVVKKYWPNHSLARADGAKFGMQFKNQVWPLLQKQGVKIDNPGKKPIRYEMTSQAKATLQ